MIGWQLVSIGYFSVLAFGMIAIAFFALLGDGEKVIAFGIKAKFPIFIAGFLANFSLFFIVEGGFFLLPSFVIISVCMYILWGMEVCLLRNLKKGLGWITYALTDEEEEAILAQRKEKSKR